MKNIEALEIFSALNNAVRLRCLHLVTTADDVCVCEVVAALKVAQPAASKALNSLRAAGLLSARREANWTYYRLNGELPDWVHAIVDSTVGSIAPKEPYRSDRKRFARLKMRPSACT